MPLLQTSGNDTADAYAGGAAAVPTYIEDVFSTWLYTGNGSTQTITNGIDLAGKGGLFWIKKRNDTYLEGHFLTDTVRGGNRQLQTNTTAAQTYYFPSTFLSNGVELYGANSNDTNFNYASWTFRKQPKFFDVVTYTGDGTGLSRQIAHSLGSAPGCIIIKRTDAVQNWKVYHRSLGNNFLIELNITDAANNQGTQVWDSQPTYFSTLSYNVSGATYVAYLYAHNAGGFGLTGTDNVISCGSLTLDSSNSATATLGWEPQFLLWKKTNATEDWRMQDSMRGIVVPSSVAQGNLAPNLSTAETNIFGTPPSATGFSLNGVGSPGDTFIYIAIRRGPMKVPTDATKVYYAATDTTTNVQMPTGFTVDTWIRGKTDGSTPNAQLTMNRLRGANYLLTSTTDAEVATNNPFTNGPSNTFTNNVQGGNGVEWLFGRAPSFHDVVCYTGNAGTPQNITHNLQVVPELIITKPRSSAGNWFTYSSATGASQYLILQTTSASGTSTTMWDNTTPTSTTFRVGNNGANTSNYSYVAYLFATCAGVSKVGSYTGTGATQTINCSFTGGARWVMIKRTNSTGDWYVWDTARGMVSGTDPSLLLNSTAAEVNANSIYTTTGGFQIVSTAAGINASGGSYLFFAVA